MLVNRIVGWDRLLRETPGRLGRSWSATAGIVRPGPEPGGLDAIADVIGLPLISRGFPSVALGQ